MKAKNLLILLEREMETVKTLQKDNALLRVRYDSLERDLDWTNRELADAQANISRLRDQLAGYEARPLPNFDGLAHLYTGQEKIPTIKQVREDFNLGLKEAKDVVDGWQAKGLWPARVIDEEENAWMNAPLGAKED